MRLLLFLLLITGACPAYGQVVAGVVTGVVADGETGKPLYPATVMNMATEETVTTDGQGHFRIQGHAGDAIACTHMGYHPLKLPAPADNKAMKLLLLPTTVRLQEYVLHPGYTPFQKDSAEMAALYGKELNTQRIKPEFHGLEVSGLISAAAQKLSKSYKQNKRFKETFRADEEQKFIDSRYTPALVGSLTPITGDSVFTFINAYPMEYAFARAATDLELKAWIRDSYKDYLRRRKADSIMADNKGAMEK